MILFFYDFKNQLIIIKTKFMCELKNESKICKVCNLLQPIELYRKTKTGFRTECRKCENQKRVERRKLKLKEDPEYRERLREYDTNRKSLSRMSK
jgi:hypothetical protein